MDLQSVKNNKQLMEKYREINVYDGWWDFMYETFKERMESVGIAVTDIYFSGFWSQGDGACFEGFIGNSPLYMEKHYPKKNQYPFIKKLVSEGGNVHFHVKHHGHYYHENSIRTEIIVDDFNGVMSAPTELQQQVLERWDEELNKEVTEFETDATIQFQGYMRGLYRDLEKEYDYLVSDDAVAETIIANDLVEVQDDNQQSVLQAVEEGDTSDRSRRSDSNHQQLGACGA